MIQCPSCSKRGYITVNARQITEASKTMILVKVEKKFICEHDFLIYIDKNFSVRNVFQCEQVVLPSTKLKREIVTEVDFSEFKIDLVKMNVYQPTFWYIFRTLLFGKKVLLVVDSDVRYLIPNVLKFFHFLFEDLLEVNLQIIGESEFTEKTNEFQNFVIIKNLDVVKDKQNLIKSYSLAVEKEITHMFFENNNHEASLIDLKDKIQDIYRISRVTRDFLEDYLKEFKEGGKKSKKLNIYTIIRYLKKNQKINVSLRYCDYIVQIVKNYYQIEVPPLYDGVEFSRFSMLQR